MSKSKSLSQARSIWKKVWYFLWYDDSWLSWIVNLVVAYILIKFVFYPGIGLLLGTNYPIVAVVSNSMEHRGGFDEWWIKNEDYYLGRNVTKQHFQDFDFKNGFNKGDIMILLGRDPKDISVGDIIVFQSMKSYPIIHRVIDKQDKGMFVFQTKGDNNAVQIREYYDPLSSKAVYLAVGQTPPSGYAVVLDETNVVENKLLGKAVIRVPWLGYVKIWFVDLLRLFGVSVAG